MIKFDLPKVIRTFEQLVVKAIDVLARSIDKTQQIIDELQLRLNELEIAVDKAKGYLEVLKRLAGV